VRELSTVIVAVNAQLLDERECDGDRRPGTIS
jgi:hypothetical protein